MKRHKATRNNHSKLEQLLVVKPIHGKPEFTPLQNETQVQFDNWLYDKEYNINKINFDKKIHTTSLNYTTIKPTALSNLKTSLKKKMGILCRATTC